MCANSRAAERSRLKLHPPHLAKMTDGLIVWEFLGAPLLKMVHKIIVLNYWSMPAIQSMSIGTCPPCQPCMGYLLAHAMPCQPYMHGMSIGQFLSANVIQFVITNFGRSQSELPSNARCRESVMVRGFMPASLFPNLHRNDPGR